MENYNVWSQWYSFAASENQIRFSINRCIFLNHLTIDCDIYFGMVEKSAFDVSVLTGSAFWNHFEDDAIFQILN